jgi:hypothetical protein
MPMLQFSDLSIALRFGSRLPFFLHRRIGVSEAKGIHRLRLHSRETDFLALARYCIFGFPENPYHRLFKHIGLSYGDLEILVLSNGLESALATLLTNGIYLTVDEFKGRKEIRRGSLSYPMVPDNIRNPLSLSHVPVRTGGSRTSGTPMMIGLDFIADCAVNTCLLLHTRGGEDWIKADWEVPGGGALFRILKFNCFGGKVVRWFSQIDPAASVLHSRYIWSARLLHWGSVVSGRPLPRYEVVSLEDPRPIVQWMAMEIGRGRTPLLFTFPTSAVRIAKAALESSISLEGAQVLISGEPITEARTESIRSSGMGVIPRYGTIEC